MTPGELVMVETGPPGQTLHAIGRAIQPGDVGAWWIDLNIGGVHLPQMYRVAEFSRSMTPEMIARHGFCSTCFGFGVPQGVATEIGEQPGVNACDTCGGSGREMVHLTVERSPHMTSAFVTIDEIAVAEIECSVCRASLTPMPS